MPRIPKKLMLVRVALMVGVCTTAPFVESSRYNAKPVSAAGTITVSHPKIYSRKALIAERGRELARVQKLIDEHFTRNAEVTAALIPLATACFLLKDHSGHRKR